MRFNRPIITVPSAWHFKPLTEVSLELKLPTGKKNKNGGPPIQCHGIIIECRPLKQKSRYHVDLLLTDLPTRHANLVQKLSHNGRHVAR